MSECKRHSTGMQQNRAKERRKPAKKMDFSRADRRRERCTARCNHSALGMYKTSLSAEIVVRCTLRYGLDLDMHCAGCERIAHSRAAPRLVCPPLLSHRPSPPVCLRATPRSSSSQTAQRTAERRAAQPCTPLAARRPALLCC